MGTVSTVALDNVGPNTPWPATSSTKATARPGQPPPAASTTMPAATRAREVRRVGRVPRRAVAGPTIRACTNTIIRPIEANSP